MNLSEIRTRIFSIRNDEDFVRSALEIFRYQALKNPVYLELVRYLGVDPVKVNDLAEIPFLPINFFKDHRIISGHERPVQKTFLSSGTTGTVPSSHFITDLDLYEGSFTRSFRLFYGDPENYRFLALLPGYLERQDSSLVYMMDFFIRKTKQNGSGFFLHDIESLVQCLQDGTAEGIRTILFGASYALHDFAGQYKASLDNVMIMETGGMKGRRKEMIREELHEVLCSSFNAKSIHSEYGMTELLSQAYSQGGGIFRAPPWMKILIRDPNDPMSILPPGQSGGINIIDLANLHSCSFIATQDLGRLHDDGSFEVLGRFDDSDIRGCNLLVV